MGWFENIKDFLNKKMKEEGLKVGQLAEASDVPETTMRKMLDNRRPEIKNILKLADYFKCSVNELLGREEFDSGEKQQYAKLSPEELSANLRSFINKELVKNDLTQSELGKKLGLSEDALRPFLKEDDTQKMLSSVTLVLLADFFKVSIDGMIGRTPNLAREQQIEKPLDNIKNLSPEVLKTAQLIGKSIKNDISKVPADGKAVPRHVSSVTKKPHSERSR
ncbi:helix-turn-helix domain-containing protein [Candidatus Tisiphia endosymbiont of Xenochironomus xenolabis]|uniref:helix-turn-helix domain-containing protein n=1 Tax=unclassified Candidatus Tisiphia TaxID=2996318 RepID=UPI0035C91783